MAPDVTVQVVTFRPAGLDVLLAGMRDQTYPKHRFEVVLVDHRYERRHAEVMELAKYYGVNLIHVPEHRRNGQWGVCSSAFNTGFAVARGRVIIMLVDWTYAPPGWIEAHLRHHFGPPVYVVAPYRYHAVGITKPLYDRLKQEMGGRVSSPWEAFTRQPKLRLKQPFDLTTQDFRADYTCLEEDAVLKGEVLDEVSAFEEGLFDPGWLPRMPPIPDEDPGNRKGPRSGHFDAFTAHLKNESVPREVIYRLNGTDIWSERGGRMSIDSEWGLRVEALGVQFVWEPQAQTECVNPRHGVCRTMPFGHVEERVGGRWNLADCEAFYGRRRREIREKRYLAAPAPYTLDALAARLEPWRTADWIDPGPLDLSDREFYGRDLWPDSLYEGQAREAAPYR